MKNKGGNRDLRISAQPDRPAETAWRTLGEFILAWETDEESLARAAAAATMGVVGPLELPEERLAGLLSAVQRAAQNACKPRDRQPPGPSLSLRILTPSDTAQAGCGWSYFLVEKMSAGAEPRPTLEVYLYPEGG